MKRVLTLEFHVDSIMPADGFVQRVALACYYDGLLQPGDVVRVPDEGIGYEVRDPSEKRVAPPDHAYLSAGDTAYASGDRAYTGCFLCNRPRSEHTK